MLPRLRYGRSACRRAVCLAAALLFPLAFARTAATQEPGDPDSGATPYPPYLKIVDSTYIPAEKNAGRQLIRLKLDLSKDLPVGTKILLKLQYTALSVDEKVLEVGRKRDDVIFDWVPRKPLGPDDYTLFSAIVFFDQTPAVQEKLRANKKAFPDDKYPGLPWTYLRKEEKIRVGTPEEFAALEEKICDVYDKLVAELGKNNNEFITTMEAVKEGKKYVDGSTVDVDELTGYIKKWRLQQAKTQKKIMELPLEDPTLHQKTLKAHRLLIDLGRMVSRRAYKAQQEVEKQYGTGRIVVRVDPKRKSELDLRFFDRNWRFKTDPDTLGRYANQIYDLTCPEPEEEPVEEPAVEGKGGDDGKKEPEGKETAKGKAGPSR